MTLACGGQSGLQMIRSTYAANGAFIRQDRRQRRRLSLLHIFYLRPIVGIDNTGGAVEGVHPWLFFAPFSMQERRVGVAVGGSRMHPVLSSPTLLPLSILPMSPGTQPETLQWREQGVRVRGAI